MSVIRNLLQQLLPNNNSTLPLDQKIQMTRSKINNFSIEQLQQFIRQISCILYKRQQQAQLQQFILQLIKQLMLGGSFPLYLFLNVYIFPWIISINKFHRSKTIKQRAKLYYLDTVADNLKDKQGKINLEQYKQLFNSAQEFLIFFGQNLKFHPNSKFKIKGNLSKELNQNLYKRQLTEYSLKDTQLLQTNLKQYNTLFRQHLKLIIDFLNDKVQECFQEKQFKFQQNLYLFLSLIQMSESYCINAIVYRIGTLINSNNLIIGCELIEEILKIGEIEATYVFNVKILPLILQFVLPVDFRSFNVLNKPKEKIQPQLINKIISYFYIWHQRTKILGLSTKIYDIAYGMIENIHQIDKLSLLPSLKEYTYSYVSYKKRLTKIYDNNQAKRSFIIDQHESQQQKIVHLLREVAFYLGNKKKDTIINENILDQLTISQRNSQNQRQSQNMSNFSQSLMQSLKNKSWENINNIKSQQKSSDNLYKKKNEIKRDFQLIQNQIQQLKYKNIYNRPFNNQKSKYQTKIHESVHFVVDHYIPQVMTKEFSKDSFKPLKDSSKVKPHQRLGLSSKESIINQSPYKQISFYSSQFSQIQNNDNKGKNKSIQSIYIPKSNKKGSLMIRQGDSGQFMYFQKDSKILQDIKPQMSKQESQKLPEDISFEDSLKLNDQEEEIIEYGMDVKAKLPQSINKPKFGFAVQDTNTSSVILKEAKQITDKKTADIFSNEKNRQIINSPLQQKNNQLKQSTNPSLQSYPNKGYNKLQYINSPQKTSKYNISLKKPSQSNSQQSNKLAIQEQDSIYSKRITFKSQSQIRQNSAQPKLISKSNSVSSGTLPKNFGSLFKKRSEKASSILSSSRSLNKVLHKPAPKITIPNLTNLHNLQNQLGKLKRQTQQYQNLLSIKQKQIQSLQKVKEIEDPYQIRRQNQLMKALLQNKKRQPQSQEANVLKTLTKQLKQSSLKNSLSLKDLTIDILKLKIQSAKSYNKEYKKNVINNRCIIIKNQILQIGYSYKNKILTLYLTTKIMCQELSLEIDQNSLVFNQNINCQLQKLVSGKQIKFKTQVNTTKDYGQFTPAQLQLKVKYQQKLNMKTELFRCELPLTPYNMAKMLDYSEANNFGNSRGQRTHYITPLYNSCEDLIKKHKQYLYYLFPKGNYNQQQNIFSIYFQWKSKLQTINIKLKERVFRLQGIGYPLQSGRQLIQAIINLLLNNKQI